MKRIAGLFLLCWATALYAAEEAPVSLERSTPESQGIASAAILDFVETAETEFDALHSLMLLRHGRVVAEGWWAPYVSERPHRLFSLSKSFTSTAVGLAVDEGLLSLDDELLSFFPRPDSVEVDPNLAAMRIRDLLAMNSGHQEDTLGKFFQREDGKWTEAFLALPVEHKPGTHFVYNTGATYMLSAVLQQVTGMKVVDYLGPRLFEPLGISGHKWQEGPEGINVGGWGLRVRTEDIARFGQLYLQDGVWNGRRLLPEGWVAKATARQTSNGSNPDSDWEQGYGYQFWRCRHDAYRGDGAFGQYCIVLPEQDAVLAITSGVGDMQAVLDLVWEKLLPAMREGSLPSDDKAHAALQDKLGGLALAPQQGAAASPLAAQVSGKTYAFEANDQELESVTVEFGGDGGVLTFRGDGHEFRIACGAGEWTLGETAFDHLETEPIAVSGAWTADDTYVAKACYYETPFCPSWTFRFEGENITFDFKDNVSFGPVDRPQLKGRVAP